MKRSLLKSLSMRFFAILMAVGGTLGAPASHVAALPDAPADAPARQTLLATAQNGQVLLAIDVDRGTSAVIGNTGVPPASLALAISPDRTTAYTVATTQNPSEAHLAKIDLSTGAETLVGEPIGQDLYIMGMIFSPDGTLYAAGGYDPDSPTFNSLYTVDVSTGLASRVGALGGGRTKSDFIMSFTFSPSGEMYGASMMSLYRIDRSTATGAKIADFVGAAKNPPQIMGIAFDKNGGLYAADHVDLPDGGSTIYALDPQTAEMTPLFNTGIAFIHNIAFHFR
jgi:WD40 repeat protein